MSDRIGQILQTLLAAGIVFIIGFGVYDTVAGYRDINTAAEVQASIEGIISERELCSLLLNAYYMGMNAEELDKLLFDYSGDAALGARIRGIFLEYGGGERYLRDLCSRLAKGDMT